MIVISDTSVISNLFSIGKLDLLPQLFEQILIPPKVNEELYALRHFELDISPILNAGYLKIQTPKDTDFVEKLLTELDEGESEAIALAVEIEADLLLIDEQKGRTIAKKLGVSITGLLGILLRAKQKGLIPEVKKSLDDLKTEANFFIGKNLYEQILELAGEEP